MVDEFGPVLFTRTGFAAFSKQSGPSFLGALCGWAGGSVGAVLNNVGNLWWLLSGVGLLGTVGVGAWRGSEWARRQRMRQAPVWDPEASEEAWPLVRLRGTVEDNARAFCAPGGRRAVYARTLFWEADAAGKARLTMRLETRGVHFRVNHAGRTVLIEPSSLELLESPRAVSVSLAHRQALRAPTDPSSLRGRIFQNEIAVGDRLELVGLLGTCVSPLGEAPPGRGIPTLTSLLPASGGRVWVRRAPPAAR